jgi:molybdopterin-guanine dinucleotide biosynthesis protein A
VSNITINSKNLAIAILIGGKSTRFGSDKGLFPLFGKPLITHQLDILSQISKNIFLIAHSKNQVQDYIDKIDIQEIMAFILDDEDIKSKIVERNPLLGLYSAFKELNKLEYTKTLVLPCDLPLIQKDVIEFLVNESKSYDCCIPQWKNGFLEPLLAIYPTKKAFVSTQKNINNQDFKLVNLVEKSWKINYVSIEDLIQTMDPSLLSFININSLNDIEHLKMRKNHIKN